MFYEQIKKLCEDNGLKITSVIKELGFSSGNISRWRAGTSPTSDAIIKFAEYFNVSTDYLLRGKELENSRSKELVDYPTDVKLIVENYTSLSEKSKIEAQKQMARMAIKDENKKLLTSQTFEGDSEFASEIEIGKYG